MQLAHPGVAAGVAEHSDFRQRPVHRLVRTLELTLALTFGAQAEALAAARQINAVHQQVRGAGYSAAEPRLLLWVHATLIDTALTAHRTFVGPLTAAEQETYYQEAKLLGGLLGLANARYPAEFADFQRYLARMLSGGDLVVDRRARELAGVVLRPRLRGVPGAAYRPLQVLTAGLLPERLRVEYQLRWGMLERATYRAAAAMVPRLAGVLPRRFRQLPPARRQALRRPPLDGPVR